MAIAATFTKDGTLGLSFEAKGKDSPATIKQL
eukprot:COSAG01_NODE_50266_length_364_cov_3.686792_1_plen_31_part_01